MTTHTIVDTIQMAIKNYPHKSSFSFETLPLFFSHVPITHMEAIELGAHGGDSEATSVNRLDNLLSPSPLPILLCLLFSLSGEAKWGFGAISRRASSTNLVSPILLRSSNECFPACKHG